VSKQEQEHTQEHPGFITYVNEETKTEEKVPISEIDPEQHFSHGIPIVKVVFIRLDGNSAKVCEFGPGDRLLLIHNGTVED
jgi:hypothetical protein